MKKYTERQINKILKFQAVILQYNDNYTAVTVSIDGKHDNIVVHYEKLILGCSPTGESQIYKTKHAVPVDTLMKTRMSLRKFTGNIIVDCYRTVHTKYEEKDQRSP